jgi:hypothetical protein
VHRGYPPITTVDSLSQIVTTLTKCGGGKSSTKMESGETNSASREDEIIPEKGCNVFSIIWK